MPYDKVNIENLLRELTEGRFITRYQVKGSDTFTLEPSGSINTSTSKNHQANSLHRLDLKKVSGQHAQ